MNTRRLALVAIVVAAGLGLAGCASSASPAPAASAAQGRNGGGFGGGQGAAGGAFPGATGLVAAVSGSTAQVQSASKQTAVTWNSSTSFTTQVAATPADITAGECVVARPARTAASGGSSASTAVAAATIEITTPVGGSCSSGFGGFAGQRPNGAPTAAPGNGGSGSTRTPRNFGGLGATGKVSSVGSDSFVVAVTRGTTSRDVTVTWTSSTTVTKQQTGAASDVVVGKCVLALGKTDDTGALTATSIAVSAPVNGSCTTGFGFGGRGGGQSGTPGGTPTTGTGGKNA